MTTNGPARSERPTQSDENDATSEDRAQADPPRRADSTTDDILTSAPIGDQRGYEPL
jgi:hypothetical protein